MNATASVDEKTMVIPPTVSYVHLNTDGSWEDVNFSPEAIYIQEEQVNKLWDPKVVVSLKDRFGDDIGIMHDLRRKRYVRNTRTRMYVSGT